MTGKKAGIVLIVNQENKDKQVKRLLKVIKNKRIKIDIWVIDEVEN